MNVLNVLQVLLALAPRLVLAVKQGQAAYEAYLEAQKVEGNDEINAGIDALKSEFTRRRLIAEAESDI